MSALVNPVGDFPLNDDWAYALAVKSILQTGQFELPSVGAANLFAQAYWGALFCLPFGFSFTALRLSTLTLGAAGILAFYLLLREIGGSRWIALLGGLTLAVNPIYFGLANTFMTDVPFLALVITTLWLLVRGVQRGEAVSLSVGLMIALLAILIRQFALLLLFAFGVAYLLRRGPTWKLLAAAMLPLVIGAGLHVFYQKWMLATGRTAPLLNLPYLERFARAPFSNLVAVTSSMVSLPGNLILTSSWRFVRYSLHETIIALPYIGFFIAPFLAAVALTGSHATGRNCRWLTRLLGAVLTGALLAAVYIVYTPVPESGHILTPSGLGPRTLRDTFLLGNNFPVVPVFMTALWFGSIAVGALGGAVLLLDFARAAAEVARSLLQPERRAATWLETLALIFVGAYATLLLLIGFLLKVPLYDRYLLLCVPMILILVYMSEIRRKSNTGPRQRIALPLALVFLYTIITVAATHDYLAWNRARWTATRTLMDAGVSPHQIDGGYEFNGWYLSDLNYHPVPNKSRWWVDGDDYIIASGPLSGYRELQRFVFRRWLLFADASVVVLHRID